MQIEFYKALWGFESLPTAEFAARVRAGGYVGVECPLFQHGPWVADEGFAYIAMDFVETVEGVARAIEAAPATGARLLNLHAGKDWWSEERSAAFLEGALKEIGASPLPVTFETHRGRLFYSAASTAGWLRRFPEIELTADLSHWVCVSESMLQDQTEAVDLAIRHTRHLHARIGHEEGPQVAWAMGATWQSARIHFLTWWQAIADACAARGQAVLTIDPEFGPPGYLPVDAEGQPVSDLWSNCQATKEWLSEALQVRPE